ncbi:MAG: Rieske 2Fe-2S domain-containing protein [Acidimicrobiia bacterium]
MAIADLAPATPRGIDDLILEDPERFRFKVHRSALTSQEVFDLEMRAFWEREWLYLGHSSELPRPGDFVRRTLAGRELIFCRSTDGQLRAFLNACPHRGTIVCRETSGNGRFFTCFYHAWSFENSGRLVALPGPESYTDVEALKDELSLRPVPRLGEYRGFVFASFATEGPSLEAALGSATDSLDRIVDQSPDGVEVVRGTHAYTSRTNWKLSVENALDGYHFAPTHQTFIEYRKSSGYKPQTDIGTWADLGGGHVIMESRGLYGRSGLDWEPAWGEDERVRIEAVRAELRARLGAERATQVSDWSRNTFVFPNLLLFDFAGISVRTLEPVAPGVTQVRAHELAPVGEPPAARRLRLDNLLTFVGPGGFATPDDIEAQQDAQIGLETSVTDVRIGVPWSDISRGYERELAGLETDAFDEGHVRTFWRHWRDRLAAAEREESTR